MLTSHFSEVRLIRGSERAAPAPRVRRSRLSGLRGPNPARPPCKRCQSRARQSVPPHGVPNFLCNSIPEARAGSPWCRSAPTTRFAGPQRRLGLCGCRRGTRRPSLRPRALSRRLGRSRGGSGALGAVRAASGAGARGAKGRGAGLGRQRAGASPTARPPRTSCSPPRGLPVAQTSRPGRGPRYLRIVEGHGGPSQ